MRPTPWSIDRADDFNDGWEIRDANGEGVALYLDEDDAKHIIKLVNGQAANRAAYRAMLARCKPEYFKDSDNIAITCELTDELVEALRNAPDQEIIALPEIPATPEQQEVAESLYAKLQTGQVEFHGDPVTIECAIAMPFRSSAAITTADTLAAQDEMIKSMQERSVAADAHMQEEFLEEFDRRLWANNHKE